MNLSFFKKTRNKHDFFKEMSHYSGIPIVVSIKDNKEEKVCVCTASANLILEMEEKCTNQEKKS